MDQIILKIKELTNSILPDLDTSEGSAFDRVVLEYIRKSFGVGDLELDISDMIQKRLRQLDPELSVDEGSALYEILIKPLSAIFEVPRLEVQRLKAIQDLSTVDDKTDIELDRRLSNFFLTRRTGDVAVGTVRAYFANPVPVRTNLTNRAVTASGLAFFPDGAFDASQNLVASNQQDGLFYVDIPYVAEAPGAQYNIAKNEIITIENMPGLVRATNLHRFQGGAPRETNQQFFDRAKKSISERSLSSKNSIITILTERFPGSLLSVVPIGMGDPEMKRDVFTVSPCYAVGGDHFQYFSNSGVGPYTLGHPDVDPESIRVYKIDGIEGIEIDKNHRTYTAGESPEDPGSITLSSDPVSGIFVHYKVLSSYISWIGNIPGSIEVPPLFESPAQTQHIHVGGKGDIYIKTPSFETGELTVENLGRAIVFYCDDGIIEQDNGYWYFRTSRNLDVSEMGILPGDVVEILSKDVYGNTFVAPGNSFRVVKINSSTRRVLLAKGPSAKVVDATVRVLMKEERALPLERLVALDAKGSPIFLSSDGTRTTEYELGVQMPVVPSLGYLKRDSSLPQFPSSFQSNIPIVLTDPTPTYRNPVRFADGVEVDSATGVGYLVADRNVASGNIQTPWIRITDVDMIDPLTLDVLEGRKIRHLRPVDIRSVDLSGGVDSDSTNNGKEASGKVRMYFEKPLTLMLYGQGCPRGRTTFTHFTSRHVGNGIYTDCALSYRLVTHGPAGGPIVLAVPEDFREENGLWYIDLFVEGDSANSVRRDGGIVQKSMLNLGDGAFMFVGDLGLDDVQDHVFGELEFEDSGQASAVVLADGKAPVDSQHPYENYTADVSAGNFVITSSPGLILSEVRVGHILKILEQADTAFLSVTADSSGNGSNSIVVSGYDLKSLGVQIGDIVVYTYSTTGSVTLEVTSVAADTVFLNGDIENDTGGTAEFYKWKTTSIHYITEIVSDTEVAVTDPLVVGSGLRFVIATSSGVYRPKSPFVRYAFDQDVDGSPGNDPNGAYRAEGFWLEARDPYNRSVRSLSYSYTTRDLTLFRYTEGVSTGYAPKLRPDGSEIELPGPSDLEGRGRDNVNLLGGSRVTVVGDEFEFIVGNGKPHITTLAANGVTYTLDDNNVDPRNLRVYVLKEGRYVELRQQPSGTPNKGHYVFISGEKFNDPDSIKLHPDDDDEGGYAVYLSRVEAVVVTSNEEGVFHKNGVVVIGTSGIASPTASNLCSLVNDNLEHLYATVGVNDLDGEVTESHELVSATDDLTFSGTSVVAATTNLSNASIGDVLYVGSGNNVGYHMVSFANPNVVESLILDKKADTDETLSTSFILYRPYRNPTTQELGLGDNFLSRRTEGSSIKITYSWSPEAREVQEFVSSSLHRSINQDLLVRYGIPVFTNVSMVVNSEFVDEAEVLQAVKDHILSLDQQPLVTSDLVRTPKIARHVPLPIEINGVTHLEDRTFRTYRGVDGFTPRRIEVILPDKISVTVNE